MAEVPEHIQLLLEAREQLSKYQEALEDMMDDQYTPHNYQQVTDILDDITYYLNRYEDATSVNM